MIKYYKLYQSLKKVSGDWHAGHIQWYYYWEYLKFFEDRTVIEASINSEDVEKINLNFTNANKEIVHGIFDFNEKEINIKINGTTISGGFTYDNKLVLMKANLTWEMYTPI